MGASIKLSFVIVTYNSAATIEDCLRSVGNSPDTEVIVVDNHSQDSTASIVAKFPHCMFLPQSQNLGFNGGNIKGAEIAQGDIIVFLNPDTIIGKEFVPKLLGKFSANAHVGVIGCRIINRDGSLQRTCNSFPTLRSLLFEQSAYRRLFPHSSAYKRYILDGWKRDTERMVDAVSGACTAVRREVLEKIGGLDDGYFLFFEEFDLSKRARNAGWLTLFTPEIIVTHAQGVSTKQLGESKVDGYYHQSQIHYMRKFYGSIYVLYYRLLRGGFNKLVGLLTVLHLIKASS
jgi:GT2 family glycosyltransferase